MGKYTVLSTVTGKDITKYYRNATQYSVQVFDATGKAVGKGEVVTFNINGRFYNRTTDENGIATLNINLPQGEYVITEINPVTGEIHSNNITVLPVLKAENIPMKYLDGSQFKANLVDGQGNPIIKNIKNNEKKLFLLRKVKKLGYLKYFCIFVLLTFN